MGRTHHRTSLFERALHLGVVLGLAAVASSAAADGMDLALGRLRVPATATGGCAIATPAGNRAYCPDDAAWRALMAQQSATLMGAPLTTARTTGWGGFYVGIEGTVSGISSGADYWQRGTEGDSRATVEGRNRFVADALFWYRLTVRKGLPLGLEVGASFQQLAGTGLFAINGELKWSVFEGFRTGIGLFPDLTIRGAVSTVVGDAQYNLTVPEIDVILSKPISIASTATISPFGGFQAGWTFADSDLVDLTPDVDAYAQCNPDPNVAAPITCRGSGDDLTNNAVFAQVRSARYRMFLGVAARYQALTLMSSFAFDLVTPRDTDGAMPAELGRQWSIAFGLGLTY